LWPPGACCRMYLSQFPSGAKDPVFFIMYGGKSDWTVRLLHLSKSLIVSISFCEATGRIKRLERMPTVQYIKHIRLHIHRLQKVLYWNSESIWFIWFFFLQYILCLEWKELLIRKREKWSPSVQGKYTDDILEPSKIS